METLQRREGEMSSATSAVRAEAIEGTASIRKFPVRENVREKIYPTTHKNVEQTTYSLADTTTERKYSRAERDANGKIIRGYIGVDMKAVYASKSLFYKFIKRLFDIVASGLGLIILSPIFLITAIAIKIEDGGPVIYSGQRWGKDFKYFPMHKFRSMCVNADKMVSQVASEENINGMAFKIVDDPRMTKMGKFMRKTSIDELPQLWNVFKCQMSLVGPRPIQTTREDGDPYEMQRWCVKPGITCIWQIDGRAEVEWDEWVEMDLQYISEMSVWTDLKLLLGTVAAVFKKSGSI